VTENVRWLSLKFFHYSDGRHPERPRFHERKEGYLKAQFSGAGDPSLRLKNGLGSEPALSLPKG
jgi:hypothetical protein